MCHRRDIPLILLLCAVDADGREVAFHQELVQLLGPGHRLHKDDHLQTAPSDHHNGIETGAVTTGLSRCNDICHSRTCCLIELS